jgi:hypothetical protein
MLPSYTYINQNGIAPQVVQYVPVGGHGQPRSKFTPEEDAMLKHIVETDPSLNWNTVAQMMPGRTARQVRERYKNYLSPHLNKGGWSEAEDELLREKFAEFGPRWSVLKKFFVNRSDVNVKNRWSTLLSQDCRSEWKERSSGNCSPKTCESEEEKIELSEQSPTFIEKTRIEPIFDDLTAGLFSDSLPCVSEIHDTFCDDLFNHDIWVY